MEKRKVPGGRPHFSPEDVDGILADMREILETGALIKGKHVKALEENFARYVGAKHGIAVNNATSALQILYQYYGVRDREVIVQNNTFMSTANTVLYAGGTPVLTDTDPEFLSAGPDEIAAKITPKTKGVAIVHVAGHIHPRLNEIKQLCKERGLFLIEDASHAHGSSFHGVRAGALTDAACFSMYPTKVMTTGLGGMITTNDDKLAEVARSLREHGNEGGLTNLTRLGNQWLMTELHATLGVRTLPHLDSYVRKRNEIAQRYTALLKDEKLVRCVLPAENTVSAFYKYLIVLDRSVDRVKVQKLLNQEYTIGAGDLYWPTVHAQPIMRRLFNFRDEDFPKTMSCMPQMLTLPIYVTMTDEDIEYVAQSLKEAIASSKS